MADVCERALVRGARMKDKKRCKQGHDEAEQDEEEGRPGLIRIGLWRLGGWVHGGNSMRWRMCGSQIERPGLDGQSAEYNSGSGTVEGRGTTATNSACNG
jgi:hypothetical protein